MRSSPPHVWPCDAQLLWYCAPGTDLTKPISHRLRPSVQRLRIRFIEIRTSRTLSPPGETRATENGTPMLESYLSRGEQRPQGSRQPRLPTSISTARGSGVPGSRYASPQHAILNGECALIAVWEPFTCWPRIVHLADTPKNQYDVHRTAVVIP